MFTLEAQTLTWVSMVRLSWARVIARILPPVLPILVHISRSLSLASIRQHT